MAKNKGKNEAAQITIVRPDIQRMRITLVGVTPLLANRRNQVYIDDEVGGKKNKTDGASMTTPKPRPTPDEQFEAARHRIDSKTDGFPAGGVKKAMVAAVRMLKECKKGDLTQVTARSLIQVFPVDHPYLMRLRYKKLTRDDDYTMLRGSIPKPTYRPCYHDWECDCVLAFDVALMSAADVLNLLVRAGMMVGIGPRRPETSSGSNGLFDVKESAQTKGRGKRGVR